jgi:hypothetical protein
VHFLIMLLEVPVRDQVAPLPWASGEGGASQWEPVAEQATHCVSQEARREEEETCVPLPLLRTCLQLPKDALLLEGSQHLPIALRL